MSRSEKILVLGLARSGAAAARLLLRLGHEVVGYDRDPENGRDIEGLSARIGGAELPSFEGFARVIQSPGIPVPADPRVVPEVQLAAEHLEAPVVAVTGTNGKSTTTVMIGAMLRSSGLDAVEGGNLGTALCSLTETGASRVVAELSSFQLEHTRSFPAAVAVLLNLAPDHLDRHGTLAAYGAAKARLAELQPREGTLVYNADDPWARDAASRASGRRVPFSAERVLSEGAFIKDDSLVVVEAGSWVLQQPLGEMAPAARMPIDNALAASVAARAAGASPEGIAQVLSTFDGLPHRASLVAIRSGVRFVNDSKATNPSATVRTIESCEGPVVWIAGGRNKGLDLEPLRHIGGAIRGVVVYGEAAGDLEGVLRDAHAVERVTTLEEAFAAAVRRAESGDTVILSPACASQDQFRSFEERGDRFVSQVTGQTGPEGDPC
jgi:UDP-N-acetylmuramoylalanine--D-glutamate ligase